MIATGYELLHSDSLHLFTLIMMKDCLGHNPYVHLISKSSKFPGETENLTRPPELLLPRLPLPNLPLVPYPLIHPSLITRA